MREKQIQNNEKAKCDESSCVCVCVCLQSRCEPENIEIYTLSRGFDSMSIYMDFDKLQPAPLFEGAMYSFSRLIRKVCKKHAVKIIFGFLFSFFRLLTFFIFVLGKIAKSGNVYCVVSTCTHIELQDLCK